MNILTEAHYMRESKILQPCIQVRSTYVEIQPPQKT